MDNNEYKVASISSGNMNMMLRVEVGSIQVSLEQLSNLQLGDFLTIGEYNKQVNLYVGDLIIARGILVDLHGMLALKILVKN